MCGVVVVFVDSQRSLFKSIDQMSTILDIQVDIHLLLYIEDTGVPERTDPFSKRAYSWKYPGKS